ncbi:uncharacterized protein LOC132755036 [Ruditapes philippinarum]|uniref:uncharacterized protein LOC132755036 n=1 Tax=Ruditapes philippinarum TaxID=129788 RepID=UPI00295B3000|nr:uncharacterized protein LOC132755036 [Ruditapes philippinarum]
MTYYIYSFLVICLSLGIIFYTQKMETLQHDSAHVHAIQTETATTLLSLKKEIDAFRAALNDEQKKKDSLNGVIDKLRAELIEERNKRKHFEETIASQQTELEIVKVAITSQEHGLKAIGPRIAFFFSNNCWYRTVGDYYIFER